ncbi:MAG: FitA-like ribbon-helix-helix domain-containing protein [Solirubrobacteraceae bacterium]
MPKTVRIRDLDDEVYARLAQRAAETEVSVPELLCAEWRLARCWWLTPPACARC